MKDPTASSWGKWAMKSLREERAAQAAKES